MIVPTKLNTKSKSTESISDIVPLLSVAANSYFPDAEICSDVDGVRRKIHRHGTKLHIKEREAKRGADSVVLTDYTSHLPEVKVHYRSRRFADEGISFSNASLRLGIRLHRVFEGAQVFDDLMRNITRMENDALISPAEARDIRENVAKFMTNDVVCEWFSERWDDVKCEAEIVASGEVRRPDRVMISGRRAVVVDYKFGDKRSARYLEQVNEYMDLLHKMNLYDEIEGYVWYVNLGEINKVVK